MKQEKADFTIIIAAGKYGYNSSDELEMDLSYEDIFTVSGFITYSLCNTFNHKHVTKLESCEGSCVLTIDVREDITEHDISCLRVEVLSLLRSVLVALAFTVI